MVSRGGPQLSKLPGEADLHDAQQDPGSPPTAALHPKDPRTKYRYNIFCRFFFFWVDPLFWVGFCRTLNQSDLYAHPGEADSEKLLNRFNNYWEKELQRKEHGQKARLWVAIYKCLWWRILLQGILLFLEICALVGQSVVLGYLSDYFSVENPTVEQTRDAYLFATALVVLSLVVLVTLGHGFLTAQKVGMMARIITTAAIYQKVLTLSQVTIGQISIGHVVNLASNDVQRFDLAFLLVHCTWIAPLHLIVFTYLVYVEVGWSAFLAAAFVLLQIPLQICLARLFAHLRFKSAGVTDQRVRIMNEVISGIRVIKMYAWEYAFRGIVTKLRRHESNIIFQGALIRACNLGFMIVSVTFITWLVFTVYVTTGGTLTPKKVFTTLSLVTFLRLTSIHFVILNALGMSEGRVALKRIQDFLELDEHSCSITEGKMCTDNSKSCVQNTAEECRKECRIVVNSHIEPSALLSPATPPATAPSDESPCVKVEGISASWSYERERLVLNNISMEVNKKASLLAVVGPVGAGKSTLLQCLLQELKPMDGYMEVRGRVLYASQEAWVFSGTLRENILFGQPYQSDRYNTVIEACALDKDIAKLSDGDLTPVGERGVTLSGGQKARVNLARVIYHDADIYLLDDPLSAVDSAIAMHLFENCIRVLLADRLVVLVTHQVQFALQADKILALKDGNVEAYGSQAELLTQGMNPSNFLGLMKEKEERDEFAYKSDDDEEEEEEEEEVGEENETVEGTVDLAHVHETPPLSPLAQQSHRATRMSSSPISPPLIQISTRTTSPPPSPIPRIQLSPKPSPLNRYKFPRMGRRMSLGIPNSFTQHKLPPGPRMSRRMSLRPPSPLPPHKFSPDLRFSGHMPHGSRISRRYTKVPPRLRRFSIYSIGSISSLLPENRIGVEEGEDDKHSSHTSLAEEKAHGRITMTTYFRYFKAGGNYLLLATLLVMFLMGEASIVVADWWLSDWADCSTTNISRLENVTLRSTCYLSTNQRIGIYTGTTAAAILVNFARTITFYFVCVNASRVLHNRMFAAVLRAPVLFFDTNPIGRVLNRFSKDIGFLDDLLPYVFCEYLLLLLRCLAIVVTAVTINAWVVIPAFLLLSVFLAVRWYYLKTSRDIKRLEAVARSPLYSHISTTLQGLPTIRTFDNQRMALDHFHKYQNEHTQGWYLYLVTIRWFGMRLDTLSTLFLATVAFISIPLASQLNAGLVGLGLTYTVSLAGMFQYSVRQSAEVENTMISAERIMGYSQLESEAPLETLPPQEKPPPVWPKSGEIVLEDVSFCYSPDFPLVLKSLDFHIKPSEKVGIVGRTGAGKSSLLAVLYRMAEPFGAITIDGVNTKEIGLHDLRQKMSIIPQDPVLFSGTMRYNLDPFCDFSDAELWDVLEQVSHLSLYLLLISLSSHSKWDEKEQWGMELEVQLKLAVQQLEGQLHGLITEGGANFSVGQRQLVCLARALLRKNMILVLDEVTAHVDIKTDAIIQETIRDKFSDCTVLTIAHRLNTVMDCDRILVVSRGHLKEFDSPYHLLQNPNSQFRRMVERTGPSASRKLQQMALDAHLRRKRLEQQAGTTGKIRNH